MHIYGSNSCLCDCLQDYYYSRKKRCSICVQQQLTKQKIFIWAERLIMNFPMGNEQITITPRNYEFDFRFAGKIKSHYALIGMAFVAHLLQEVIRFIMMLLMKKALEWQVLILSAMRHMKKLCRKMKQKSAR